MGMSTTPWRNEPLEKRPLGETTPWRNDPWRNDPLEERKRMRTGHGRRTMELKETDADRTRTASSPTFFWLWVARAWCGLVLFPPGSASFPNPIGGPVNDPGLTPGGKEWGNIRERPGSDPVEDAIEHSLHAGSTIT
eukprot:gene9099-biopygen7672